MFYIKILNIKIILILIVYNKISCQIPTITNIQQSEIPSSSLTGAYRPAEIQTYYNTTTRNHYCHQESLAKYIVSIRKHENDKNFGHTHFCGGVIIKSNLILTAAHCLIRNKQIIRPAVLKVVAKAPMRLNRTAAAQIMRVRQIMLHEKFSSSSRDFDIALLKLSKHILLDHCAAVIALPKHRFNANTPCSVLGWGKLYLSGPMANEVLQLNVTLRSRLYCDLLLDVGTKKICASDKSDNEKNPCSGDSGGPLICEGVLVGLVSYGFQCGYGLPTVYTDVYEYSSWISENQAVKFNVFIPILTSALIIVVINTSIFIEL